MIRPRSDVTVCPSGERSFKLALLLALALEWRYPRRNKSGRLSEVGRPRSKPLSIYTLFDLTSTPILSTTAIHLSLSRSLSTIRIAYGDVTRDTGTSN